jgi:hypothetical protein
MPLDMAYRNFFVKHAPILFDFLTRAIKFGSAREMEMRTNVYQDLHTGGWIAEFCYKNERKWIRIGVFGTRAAARSAAGR